MEDLEAWDDPPMVMPRLRSLELINCPKLQALPPIFTTSLRVLRLESIPLINMRFLPPKGIEVILLCGLPTRRVLMESPSLPTTLKHLTIADDYDLTELPVDDLLRLASLRELEIAYCPNLETLPEEMSRLPQLEVLHIEECPKLEEKCREGGLLWPIIRHIPTIRINWRIGIYAVRSSSSSSSSPSSPSSSIC